MENLEQSKNLSEVRKNSLIELLKISEEDHNVQTELENAGDIPDEEKRKIVRNLVENLNERVKDTEAGPLTEEDKTFLVDHLLL